jgi:hypothetical protein
MSSPPSLPSPPRERWPPAIALLALLAGAGLVTLALAGAKGPRGGAVAGLPQTPALVVVTPAPAAAITPQTGQAAAPAAAAPAPKRTERAADEQRFVANDRAHVPADWVSGFYDIYATAQRTFGVNWLLIASVHKQETGFSTHPTTYRGLNFARCCAGPMQFNVTNGPSTTWSRYRTAGARAQRPARYPHPTAKHPSVYDDYDSIMAAAALLRDSGAGGRLDASAWRAAYDYYGHDLTGVSYANEVLARAIGWGQKTFCINCMTDGSLVGAVDAAWGAPVRGTIPVPTPKATKKHQSTKKDPQALAARKQK